MYNTTTSCSDHMLDHYVKYYRPIKAFQKLQSFKKTNLELYLYQHLDCSFIQQHVRFDCGFEHNHNTTFSTHITCDQSKLGKK